VDWPVWSEKFQARADTKGYLVVPLGKKNSPEEGEEPSSNATEEQIKEFNDLLKANEQGYLDLVLLINGETDAVRVSFGIIKGSKGKKKPGDCALAWAHLNNKFEPKSAPSRMTLKKKFLLMNLKPKEDTDKWLTSLEDLKEQLVSTNARMDEDDVLEHALNNLPKEYDIVVAQMEKRLSVT